MSYVLHALYNVGAVVLY